MKRIKLALTALWNRVKRVLGMRDNVVEIDLEPSRHYGDKDCAMIYGEEGKWMVRMSPAVGESSIHGPFRRIQTARAFARASGDFLISEASVDLVGGPAVAASRKRPMRRYMHGPKR